MASGVHPYGDSMLRYAKKKTPKPKNLISSCKNTLTFSRKVDSSSDSYKYHAFLHGFNVMKFPGMYLLAKLRDYAYFVQNVFFFLPNLPSQYLLCGHILLAKLFTTLENHITE